MDLCESCEVYVKAVGSNDPTASSHSFLSTKFFMEIHSNLHK